MILRDQKAVKQRHPPQAAGPLFFPNWTLATEIPLRPIAPVQAHALVYLDGTPYFNEPSDPAI